MIFINPRTDFAFKKIFGSEQSHDILISFLNGILYAGEPAIQDLTIINPYQAPIIKGLKSTYLDIKAELKTGEMVVIEMQVLNVAGFEKRILYNAAKAYSIELAEGQFYANLNPVIALTITDFIMFDDMEQYLSRFMLQEKDCLIDYPIQDLELVFVELPKFKRSLSELESLSDRWIYFLQHAPDLETIPEKMAEIPEMNHAFAIANKATLTREELDEQHRQSFFIHDQRGVAVKALEQGIKQGIEQGIRENQVQTALRLLPILDDETIEQTTGLPIGDIQKLRNQSTDL
ncbi:MAG: Rpn family recombination-promoting nuclease/putative transposase [Alkalinema sp. CAN_BIN05]|nr:Rpn family recombination-promoting nuclease/putative transposase [Alkalinema sp. CAN_BIN05]